MGVTRIRAWGLIEQIVAGAVLACEQARPSLRPVLGMRFARHFVMSELKLRPPKTHPASRCGTYDTRSALF